MNNLMVSKYLHYIPVGDGVYIGWNRFFPSIFVLNDAALRVLEDIDQKKTIEINENIDGFIKEAKKRRFLVEGENDSSREDFIRMANKKLDEMAEFAENFYRQGGDYDSLSIGNDICNLSCSYCIGGINGTQVRQCRYRKTTRHKKMAVIMDCIGQFFRRKIENGVTQTRVFFNGGEILADWPAIKTIIEEISTRYPGINVEYGINTNLTLLTEEIARFFNRCHFKVHISIDGYKEAHDKTRIYHNGKGSFDDIIRKVELYRKYNEADTLTDFQGTIDGVDEFQPEEVYAMEKYGFKQARLAPNLLNVPEADARKKAQLMGKFLELNSNRAFQVKELIFSRAKDRINLEQYQFKFNCVGLFARPQLDIFLNLTTLAVSHLCGYIKRAAVPLSDLQYDIYNPRLWKVSYGFVKERLETLLKDCMECPFLGICRGSCIMSGIDLNNRINKAACAYQKEIMEIYIKRSYRNRNRKKE